MSAKRSASKASDSAAAGKQNKATWSVQAYTVQNLLEQFSLPQIVKCNPQAIMVKKDSPLPVNLGLPLLLFDSRTIRKLLARNVVFDTTAGKFTENDDTVVIPKDYEGKVYCFLCFQQIFHSIASFEHYTMYTLTDFSDFHFITHQYHHHYLLLLLSSRKHAYIILTPLNHTFI